MYSKILHEGEFLKEKHSGGLVGHFGHDKTFSKLNGSYFWPGMRIDVKKFLERCRICQHTKVLVVELDYLPYSEVLYFSCVYTP
jgi:hypothetical protein